MLSHSPRVKTEPPDLVKRQSKHLHSVLMVHVYKEVCNKLDFDKLIVIKWTGAFRAAGGLGQLTLAH